MPKRSLPYLKLSLSAASSVAIPGLISTAHEQAQCARLNRQCPRRDFFDVGSYVKPITTGGIIGTKIAVSSLLKPHIHIPKVSPRTEGTIVASLAAGAADVLVTTAFWPTQHSKRMAETEDTIKLLLEMGQEDPRHLFTGLGAQLMRSLPATMVKGGAYYWFDKYFKERLADVPLDDDLKSMLIAICSGFAAAVATTVILHPYNITRMGMRFARENLHAEVSFLDVLTEYVRLIILQPVPVLRELLALMWDAGLLSGLQAGIFEATFQTLSKIGMP